LPVLTAGAVRASMLSSLPPRPELLARYDSGLVPHRFDWEMPVKAVVYDRYGSPDVLRVDDVPVPSPAARQVLVKVAATSVNLSDWETLRGSPLYSRLGGLRSPARPTLGSDIAGCVDVVGDGGTRFRPGDEVYGDNLALKGGFAEYAVVPESALSRKPAELTFAEASTIPQAGAIALQGTNGAAVGRRVLINGGGGGSGSFAIQLAKRFGAHVTGVDNAGKLDFMRSLGADDVIDYGREDFTRPEERYDLILDLVAHRSVFAYRRALARGGRYRCVGGSVSALLRVLTIGWIAGRLTRRRIGVLAVKEGPTHFEPLADLCVAREVSIHIDRTFGLAEVPEALAHVGEGRALGKVVVTMS
jgi:NADPH:quinone reductase-like Zn-dependent oxidoreductase